MHITVNGARLFFEVIGPKYVIDGTRMRERPTVLLLHGGPGFDHSSLRPYYEVLSDVAQLVFLDHRGNGRSDWQDPSTWRLEQWGDDIAAFCDALGIMRPIVIGQSFGGFVTQSYATRHPAHPAKIGLIVTAARMDIPMSLDMFEKLGGAEVRAIAAAFFEQVTFETSMAFMQKVMPLYSHKRRRDPDAAKRAIMQPGLLGHFFDFVVHRGGFDFRPALARIACPALVVGGHQDPIIPFPLVEELAAYIPQDRMQLLAFPEAGHSVAVDEPEAYFAALRRFITDPA